MIRCLLLGTNTGNKTTGGTGPGSKTFTPATGATGTAGGQTGGAGQTNINKGQNNAPKPPPPPPPKQGDKNAKCDPKVQKCPP